MNIFCGLGPIDHYSMPFCVITRFVMRSAYVHDYVVEMYITIHVAILYINCREFLLKID